MAKTVLQPGMVVTSAFLNALNNPVFDGADVDGHRDKISDAELSDTGIKSVVSNILGGFEVSLVSGTTFEVSEGTYYDNSGNVVNMSTTTINLPSDGTFFIQLVDSGITYSTAQLPISFQLAKVSNASGSNTSLVDVRTFNKLQANPSTVRVFGGLGSQGSLRVTGSLVAGRYNLIDGSWVADVNGDWEIVNPTYTLTGENYFDNFVVDSGADVLIEGGAILYCSGYVDISGIVVVTPLVNGGSQFKGTILTQADVWSNPGNGLGGANGHNDTSAVPYHYTLSLAGSGGASSYIKTRLQGGWVTTDFAENIYVEGGAGGMGGGYFVVECGGTVSLSGTISAPGGSATAPSLPTGVNATYNRVLISGAGGGSGGLIFIKSRVSITTTPSVVLGVPGGDGNTGWVTSNISATNGTEGGGGGSGGYVVLASPNNNLIGWNSNINLNLNGGDAGSTFGSQSNTLSGANGGSYASPGGDTNNPGSPGVFLDIGTSPI